MTKKQIKDLHNLVYLKYRKQIKILFVEAEEDDFNAYVGGDRITIPECTKRVQSEWTLFAFLHEIGHIKTNTLGMKRYEMEYLATQWALEEAKRIGFKVPANIINVYQEYIDDWRRTSISHKGKNVWPESRVQLRR